MPTNYPPLTSEFQVNQITFNMQSEPTITKLSNGGFVAAWTDTSHLLDSSASGIVGRLFNADGTPNGNDFLINSNITTDYQYRPSIAALSGGGFVVTWQDESHAATDTSQAGIRGRVFNNLGHAIGSEFQANTSTVNDQYQPSVTGLSDGGFVVTFIDYSSGQRVARARLFNADGSSGTIPTDFVVSGTSDHSINGLHVSALQGGGFVATWSTVGLTTTIDQDGGSIVAVTVSASGTVSPEFQVNSTYANDQQLPCITTLANGKFVISWTDFSQVTDTSGSGIRARLFNADGSASGPDFQVNTTTAYGQWYSSISALSNGGFVITWGEENDGSDEDILGIRARTYDANGTPDSEDYLVNSTIVDNQETPTVTGLSNGRFVVAWKDFSLVEDTSSTGIRARVFGLTGDTPAAVEKVDQSLNLSFSAGGMAYQADVGNDTLVGSRFNDTLSGADGNDAVVGGLGDDQLNGNQGNDTVSGGEGNDWVVGGQGNDLVSGEAGNDVVYGNLGNDTALGGDGADTVRGGQGDDSVSGGAGNDWLWGDRGSDTISGGAGADSFHSVTGAGIDRVIDFNRAEGDQVILDGSPKYTLSQVGADTVIDMGNGDQMILVGVTYSTLSAGWIVGG